MTPRHRRDSPRKRPGGRSARVVASVQTAVLEVLAKRGYQELSIAEVAQRASIHETSIYRRWGTKARLVSEAIIQNSAEDLPDIDTGSFHRDILTLLRQVVARLRKPIGNAVGLVVASQDPELAALRRAYWSSRQKVVGAIVARAQERGEMPRTFSPQLALELFSGPILLRLTAGKPVSARYLEDLVARVIIALRGKAPAGLAERKLSVAMSEARAKKRTRPTR